jgi:hypothetical protein
MDALGHFGGDFTGTKHAFARPDRVTLGAQHVEDAVSQHLRHHQPRGIRADVNGRDHVPLLERIGHCPE